MLDKRFDKIKFLMENFCTSTNAVGMALIGSSGDMLGEYGELDLYIISDAVSLISARSRDLYKFLNGIDNEEFCLYSEGSKGSFVVYSVSTNIFMIVFFPSTTDIFMLKNDFDKVALKMRELLSAMSAGNKVCRL